MNNMFNVVAQNAPSLVDFHDGIHHWNLEHKERNYHRYSPEEFEKIADNLIAYQNKDGGWMKNIDWLAAINTDSVTNTLSERYKQSTLDNRNIFPQVRYLAEVYTLTGNKKYRNAAIKGLNYMLLTQKTNGGWRGWDVDAITFNDDVSIGPLTIFRDILEGDPEWKWINNQLKKKVARAYNYGIACILRCQVVQNGEKTAWAQQHDNETFLPVGARTYELPGLTANESCDVILFLMSIKKPSAEIIDAVNKAVEWLEEVKISGIRVERINLSEDQIINHEYPYDNVVVKDTQARPIWARFYEVEDNTPFMATRQGEKVWKLADVNAERRTGYAWYGYWPEKVLMVYDEWKNRIHEDVKN